MRSFSTEIQYALALNENQNAYSVWYVGKAEFFINSLSSLQIQMYNIY